MLSYGQESSIQSVNNLIMLVMDNTLSNFSLPGCIQKVWFILGGMKTKAD